MRKLTHQELLERQKNLSQPKLPFTVVLNNIRSLYNVGSIFRTADGVGVEKIWLCGITGIPGGSRSRIEKTALGAEQTVPWEYHSSAASVIRDLRNQGYQIILLEQAERSISYETFEPTPPVCLVLGNGISGVENTILDLCDVAVETDMAGLKNSLNVTVAFGIVAYHMRNKLQRVKCN